MLETLEKKKIFYKPEDWAVRSIQSLLEDRFLLDHLDGNHGELYPKSHEFVSSGIPYISANDFTSGQLSFANCKFLTQKRGSQFKKGIAKNGDILFAHNATVGPVALLKSNFDYVILSTTATYFRCNSDKLSNIYFLYALQSLFFINQYKAVMIQSTRAQIPITTQRKLSVLIPPTKAEQTAIATALSDADALITSLERLIAKKKDIKQGAMQELLKPKGTWLPKQLGSIVDIIGGGTPSTFKKEYWTGNINWFTPTEIGTSKYSYQSQRKISKEGLMKCSATLLPVGSILLTSRATIGEVSILKAEACTNQGFQSLVPKTCYDSEFIYYLMLSSKHLLIQNASGSTFLEISPKKLKSIELHLPSYSKQKEISQTLADMDAEIILLEKKLEKHKHIKQGTMQVLLTGKVRLL